MEIELVGLGIPIAIGLALMGYFIGKGLQNFSTPEKQQSYQLISEEDLPFYIHLSKEEVEELLTKYPGAPKIELNGTTYYPYKQFIDWLTSNEIYKK